MSNFDYDLNQESILSEYLDTIYSELNFDYQRVNDINRQHRGVDLEITHKNQPYFIDEKAQLQYLNKTLPTFAFELSYLKYNQVKYGWLFV